MIKRILILSFFGLSSIFLTGCLEADANIKLGQDARANGKLIYSIDKSFAEFIGITSLNDLKSSPDQISATTACKGYRLYESASSYITDCTLNNSQLLDEDFSAKIVDNQIVFRFRSISETDSGDFSFGSNKIRVTFPGNIKAIQANNSSLVRQINKKTIQISGLATDSYDITVYASCGKKCEISKNTSIDNSNVIDNSGYVKAKKTIGGMVRQNTVFTKANSPYTINKTLEIPRGITVKVEPGVTINSKASTMFKVQGDLLMQGKADQRINLNGKPQTFFNTKGKNWNASINLDYVNLNGGGEITFLTRGGWKITNSRIIGVKNYWYAVSPREFFLKGNVFKNSGGIDLSANGNIVTIQNNLFDGKSTRRCCSKNSKVNSTVTNHSSKATISQPGQ
jgi:hypothetical protein